MRNLHESIANMLLGKKVTINENHDEVVKKLNAAAGKDIGGETPDFVHDSGHEEDGPQDKPKHKSPVKDHYYHQGMYSGDDTHEHHIIVSHHKDNTATVQHVHLEHTGEDEYDEHHHEKHFKDLPSAIEHVKTLHTPM